jgi:hypothetical protein
MSKAKELLEKLKRRREEAEAVCAYWAEVLPNLGHVPEAHLQSWLGTFDFDTIVAGIDAAVVQRSKRQAKDDPMEAGQAVLYASAVMRNLKYKSLPEEERERIRAAKSEAGKKGNAKRWQGQREVATVCDDLRQSATTSRTTCSSSGSGSSSLSSTHTATASSEAKPAAAVPPVDIESSTEEGGRRAAGVRSATADQFVGVRL